MRQRSVSHPRSSNRTCRSPASGSPTGFIERHTEKTCAASVVDAASFLLRLSIQLSLKDPDHSCVCRLIANHIHLAIFESTPEVRALCSAGITRPQRSYGPVRLPPEPSPGATLRPLPSPSRVSPDCSDYLSDVPCPLPRRIARVLASIASPRTRPSPNGRRVGIRIVTFGACSGFTRVTARRIAQPPKATFVTRLRPNQLPSQAARQLPDQSTTLRLESSSTDNPRLRGALPKGDIHPIR
jgi:hypothetical protein